MTASATGVRAAGALSALLLIAAPANAAEFVVCDNGIRCVRAPCPSRNAVELATRKVTRISDIDLSRLPTGEKQDGKGPLRDGLYDGTGVVDAELAAQDGKPARIVVARYLRPATPAERRLCRPGR